MIYSNESRVVSNHQPPSNIFSSKGLSLVSLNIVTLPGKIDEFRLFMQSRPIDIMALNETRLLILPFLMLIWK